MHISDNTFKKTAAFKIKKKTTTTFQLILLLSFLLLCVWFCRCASQLRDILPRSLAVISCSKKEIAEKIYTNLIMHLNVSPNLLDGEQLAAAAFVRGLTTHLKPTLSHN